MASQGRGEERGQVSALSVGVADRTRWEQAGDKDDELGLSSAPRPCSGDMAMLPPRSLSTPLLL